MEPYSSLIILLLLAAGAFFSGYALAFSKSPKWSIEDLAKRVDLLHRNVDAVIASDLEAQDKREKARRARRGIDTVLAGAMESFFRLTGRDPHGFPGHIILQGLGVPVSLETYASWTDDQVIEALKWIIRQPDQPMPAFFPFDEENDGEFGTIEDSVIEFFHYLGVDSQSFMSPDSPIDDEPRSSTDPNDPLFRAALHDRLNQLDIPISLEDVKGWDGRQAMFAAYWVSDQSTPRPDFIPPPINPLEAQLLSFLNCTDDDFDNREDLCNQLLEAGAGVSCEAIEEWTVEQCREARAWCEDPSKPRPDFFPKGA